MTTPDTTTPHGGAPTLDAMAERLRDHLEGAWGYEMGLHDVKLALADALTGLSPGPERDAAVATAMSRLSGPAADAAGLVDAVRDADETAYHRAGADHNPPPSKATMFGVGKVVVETGTFHGKPAVFIAPAREGGQIGAEVSEVDMTSLDALDIGETVWTFLTIEHARAVADVLCGQAYPSPYTEKLQQEDGSAAALDAALATRPAIAEVAQTDDEILDDFALALTAENPARNELRDARQAVLSRMKGTSR